MKKLGFVVGMALCVLALVSCSVEKVETLTGYMVIKDQALHFDPVEIVEAENKERVKALNLVDGDMPNGYVIINELQEVVVYGFADQVEYVFTDVNLDFVKESEGDRVYQTTKKEEFLKHISGYNLNAIPLFEQKIPYFIEVRDGKVIRVKEEFKYTN